MFDTDQRRAVLLAAVLVLSAVAAGTAAASLTMDSETTDTASTSEWTDGTTVTDPHNSSKAAYLEFDSTNASKNSQATVYLTVNDSDVPQDGTQVFSTTKEVNATNASANQFKLATNLTYSKAFKDLEHEADQNVTVDVKIVVNESKSTAENTTFQVTVDTGNQSRVAVSTNETEKDASGKAFGFSLSFLPGVSSSSDAPPAAAMEDETRISSNTTTVVLTSRNTSFTDAANASLANVESGTMSKKAVVYVNGEPVPVFENGTTTSDVSWLDSDESYATVKESGAIVKVHNVDAIASTSDNPISVSMTANDKIGRSVAMNILTNRGVSGLDATLKAVSAADLNGNPFDSDSLGGAGAGLIGLLLGGAGWNLRRRGAL